jgi:ERCC4-related helicase
MVHVKKLRGKMAEKGRSGIDMARVIKKTPKTFYEKMKKGVFDSDEITAIVEDLEIENPMEIFFAEEVTR